MARPKLKTETEVVLAPLLVPVEEAARLYSVTPETIDQLINEGLLLVRTLAGKRLVRMDRLLQIASEKDPEPINWAGSVADKL